MIRQDIQGEDSLMTRRSFDEPLLTDAFMKVYSTQRHKYAVVTIAVGDVNQEMLSLSKPFMQCYADKIAAELIVIDDRAYAETPHAAKAQLYYLLQIYDRIIYLDNDTLIGSNCENLFETVPEELFGAFPEGKYQDRTEEIQRCNDKLGDIQWINPYINSGVMVVSKCHAAIFKFLLERFDEKIGHSYDQGYINWILNKYDIEIFELSPNYNHMNFLGYPNPDTRIVHFAHVGFRNVLYKEADIYTAKYSDMKDTANYVNGVVSLTFDAERLIAGNGAHIVRNKHAFSRIAVEKASAGPCCSTPTLQLPRGVYLLSADMRGDSAAAQMKVVFMPSFQLIVCDTRPALHWEDALEFYICDDIRAVRVEIAAQSASLEVVSVILVKKSELPLLRGRTAAGADPDRART